MTTGFWLRPARSRIAALLPSPLFFIHSSVLKRQRMHQHPRAPALPPTTASKSAHVLSDNGLSVVCSSLMRSPSSVVTLRCHQSNRILRLDRLLLQRGRPAAATRARSLAGVLSRGDEAGVVRDDDELGPVA